MALKAVLFDMDGVIVDTEPLHRKAYYQTFQSVGIDVSDELYSTFTGASTQKVFETIIEKFSLKNSADELMLSKRTAFKDYFYNDVDFDLVAGVRELIQHYYSNGIKLVLASSATRTTIDMVFEKFGLEKYFIGKISGADLKASKPHPEIFLLAAEISGKSKENCMVIEDSTNGILAAHRAGIFCAGYKSKNTFQQDYSLANIVVSNFKELELSKLEPYFN